MTDGRNRLVVQIAQKSLRDGPVDQSVIFEHAKQAGVRGLDESALWEIVTRHGIAELQGRTYVPRGWSVAPIGAPVGVDARVHPRGSVGHRSTQPQSAPTAHKGPEREIDQLRAGLQLTSLSSETSVGAQDPAWPGVARQMLGALSDELQTATRQLSTLDVHVQDGRVIAAAPTHQVLRFDVQGELPTGEGSEVILLIGSGQSVKEYPAEILSVFGSEVTIAAPPACQAPAVARGP